MGQKCNFLLLSSVEVHFLNNYLFTVFKKTIFTDTKQNNNFKKILSLVIFGLR